MSGIATRQNIINKSLQLFSVKGYFNTSINDILQVTDLTKGGLYGHFDSKEDVWYAVYDEAALIWKGIVFRDVKNISDPLERLEKVISNHLKNYIGGRVFKGGCFFLNSMIELAGQSSVMCHHVSKGYKQFSRLFLAWLKEADQKDLLRKDLHLEEISNFILVTLNGAAALYTSGTNAAILDQTMNQLHSFIEQLRK